jgi:hypothetical protein
MRLGARRQLGRPRPLERMRVMRRAPRTARNNEMMVASRKMIFSVRERIAVLLLAVRARFARRERQRGVYHRGYSMDCAKKGVRLLVIQGVVKLPRWSLAVLPRTKSKCPHAESVFRGRHPGNPSHHAGAPPEISSGSSRPPRFDKSASALSKHAT